MPGSFWGGTTLSSTEVCGHLRVPHRPKTNLVWCATSQIAWQAFFGDAGHPGPATAFTESMDRAEAGGIDPSLYSVHAGPRTPDLIRAVEEDLRERFGETEPQLTPIEGEGAAAYAFMAARVNFDPRLERAVRPFPFRESFVESFGLWKPEPDDDRVDKVIVHYPVEDDCDEDGFPKESGFVVELIGDRPDLRLIVAEIPPGETLGDTVERAVGRLRKDIEERGDATLTYMERFQVPVVDFDLRMDYKAPGLDEFIQRIKFRLDESGADLKSETRIGALCMVPRELSVSRAFLVLLMNRDVPILASWHETDELLEVCNPIRIQVTRENLDTFPERLRESQARAIEFSGVDLNRSHFEAIARTCVPVHIESFSGRLSDDALRPLADADLSELESFKFSAMAGNERILGSSLGTKELKALKTFDVMFRVSDDDLRHLLPILPSTLRLLHLSNSPVGADASVIDLWRSAEGLEGLSLFGCPITDDWIIALLPKLSKNLRRLDLSKTRVGDKAANALVKAEHLTGVTFLGLSGTGVSSESAGALRAAPQFRNLEYLGVK